MKGLCALAIVLAAGAFFPMATGEGGVAGGAEAPIVALDAAGSAGGGPEGGRAELEAAGVRASLPPGWRRVAANQPPAISDPIVRFAVASGPVRRVRSACHVGAYAVPASAALVVLLEWQHLPETAAGALSAAEVSFEDLHLRKGNLACFSGRGGAVSLSESGRSLAAYVMLGERAGRKELGETLAVVRSLRATARSERPRGLYDTPTDVALAGGQVWLSSVATEATPDGGLRPVHQVERFDPTTLARTAGPLRLEAAWGLEEAPRRPWVIGRRGLKVLDPTAALVVGRLTGLRWPLEAIAITGRTGWAIESQVNRLRRIELRRARLVGPWRRPGPRGMLSLALGEGALWVTEIGPRLPRAGVSPTPRGRGMLYRLDPATGRIEGRLRVGRGPGAVAVGFGSVWVMNGPDGTLTRVDPSRVRAVATIRFAEPGGSGAPSVDLAIGPDRVWVADPGRGRTSLRSVDSASNRVIVEPSVSTGSGSALAVAAGPEGVFVALTGGDHGRLCRVEPDSGQLHPCIP